MIAYLDFEKPFAELQSRIAELRETANAGTADIGADIDKLEVKAQRMLQDTYSKLTPWQKTQVARHPERPHFKEYIAALFNDLDRKSTRLNSSHVLRSRMPSSA